jgi:hypothetical protein
MTLPASGAITIAQVAAELGISATGLNLNDSRVRTLAGVPSGAISLNNLHGKTQGAVMSVAAPNVQVFKAGTGTGTVSGSSTATPTGGTGPYSYSWAVSGVTSGITINNAAIANPIWSRLCANGTDYVSTWICTVTDSAARTATATISVELGGYPY